MHGPHLTALLEYVRRDHARTLPGILEAEAVDPERFAAYAELFLAWGATVIGPQAIPTMVDAFVRFSTEVNFAQARYESVGTYQYASYAECWSALYSQDAAMDDYLWGLYLTNFLWAHHMELSIVYERDFLRRLPSAARLLEVAPGHGVWGVWALYVRPQASLEAYDISPSSIKIASVIASAAGVADRAHYHNSDALGLQSADEAAVDACICSFLIEHLENPGTLFEVLHRHLRNRGFAYVSGALTAAQADHIYEFRRESELALIAEEHGFRLLQLHSAAPRRTLPKARFLPRSVALILQKRTSDTW